jgi:hypothetical protein
MSDGLTPAYDWKISLKKAGAGLFSALVSILPALGPALVDYFLTGSNLTDALARTDPKLLVYAPFINAVLRFIANNRKQAQGR